MRTISITAICLLMSAVNLNVHADVYKWTDSQGHVHFGDQAPQTKTDVKVLQKSENPGDAGSGAQPTNAATPAYHGSGANRDHDRRVVDILRQERAQKDKSRKNKREEKKKLQEECTVLKNQMTENAKASVYYRNNKDGTRQFLSDVDRQAADAATKQKYDQKCLKVMKEKTAESIE